MQTCSDKIAKMNGINVAIEMLQGVIENFNQYTEEHSFWGNADFPFLRTDKYKAADCTYTEGNTSFNVTFPSLLHLNASRKGDTLGNITEDLQSFIKELDKEKFVVAIQDVISFYRLGEKNGTGVQFKFKNADIAKRLFLRAKEKVHGQPGFAIDGARNVHNVLFTNNTTENKIKALVIISRYLDEESYESILINRKIKDDAKSKYQKTTDFTDELFLGVLQEWLDKLKKERLKLEEKEAAKIVGYAKSSRNSDIDLEDAQDVIASIEEFAERLDDLTENTQAIQDAKVTIKKYLQEVTQIIEIMKDDALANTNASFVDKAQ